MVLSPIQKVFVDFLKLFLCFRFLAFLFLTNISYTKSKKQGCKETYIIFCVSSVDGNIIVKILAAPGGHNVCVKKDDVREAPTAIILIKWERVRMAGLFQPWYFNDVCITRLVRDDTRAFRRTHTYNYFYFTSSHVLT